MTHPLRSRWEEVYQIRGRQRRPQGSEMATPIWKQNPTLRKSDREMRGLSSIASWQREGQNVAPAALLFEDLLRPGSLHPPSTSLYTSTYVAICQCTCIRTHVHVYMYV